VVAKVGFVGNGRARHGVLQTLYRTTMAITNLCVAQLLAMVLHQRIELVAARIKHASQMQRDVGDMVGMRLPKLVRPLLE
jgi:hypothetical protein